MTGWLARARTLHEELTALAGDDPRWWLLASGAALAEQWPARPGYFVSDAEPAADTFIGYRAAASAVPYDPMRDAIERARAARTALLELDGAFPGQPLAVTLARHDRAFTEPSELDIAAFAIRDTCVIGVLDDPHLLGQLHAVARGATTPPAWHGHTPFVCVSIGDDPLTTARHAHRRAWINGRGPWLGLGRAGELTTVSTCHMIVDGYGHATLTGRIQSLIAEARARPSPVVHPALRALSALEHARLPPIPDAVPLAVAWQELDEPLPRVLPLAYAIGRILHRTAERPDASFSPTLQIPVAPGLPHDPERRRRRAMPAALSVRFPGGQPEPFETFAERARGVLARETAGTGLCARLVAAARATPTPLAWKRKSFSTERPRWLDKISDVLGGRAFVSKIRIDTPLSAACAVSSPSRTPAPDDLLGAWVVTVVDDGQRAAITVCSSAASWSVTPRAFLDEILSLTYGATQRSLAKL